MQTAFLRGRDHQQVGRLELEGLPSAAVALSLKCPKLSWLSWLRKSKGTGESPKDYRNISGLEHLFKGGAGETGAELTAAALQAATSVWLWPLVPCPESWLRNG